MKVQLPTDVDHFLRQSLQAGGVRFAELSDGFGVTEAFLPEGWRLVDEDQNGAYALLKDETGKVRGVVYRDPPRIGRAAE